MKHLVMMAFALMMVVMQLSAQSKNKDFKVVRTTQLMSYGGAAGSGSSTTYSVQLIAKRKMTLIGDSGFAQGKADALHILKDSFTSVDRLSVKKGDTVDIVLTIRDETSIGGGDFQKSIPGSPLSNPPKKSKGVLVLRYQGGKHKILDINNIEKLETIFAP